MAICHDIGYLEHMAGAFDYAAKQAGVETILLDAKRSKSQLFDGFSNSKGVDDFSFRFLPTSCYPYQGWLSAGIPITVGSLPHPPMQVTISQP